MMNICPKIIIICGPSGAGKGTLINLLIEDFPDIYIPPSYTTRPERPIEGPKKYHFVNEDEFNKAVKVNKILEYVKEHNYLFGTDKDAIDGAIIENKVILLEIEPRGANHIRKLYPSSKIIFIAPKSFGELEDRIRYDNKRGSTISEQELELRLKEAKKELTYQDKADYVVVNGDGEVEKAYGILKGIISSA